MASAPEGFSRKPQLDIAPAEGIQHTHTVIFLHGRGDTADMFSQGIKIALRNSDGNPLPRIFPTFRWVFPSAGIRPVANSAMHGTDKYNQWFDVWHPGKFSEREDYQAPGLRESVAHIRDLIADEAQKLGGQYDRIILMGISMGGATSVHTLLNICLPPGYTGPKRLGAFVGFSCRMPFAGRSLAEMRGILGLDGVPNDEILANTPMMLQHCADDGTVPIQDGKRLADELWRLGSRNPGNAWKVYPSGGHWFKSPEGVDDVTVFLKQVLISD